MVSGFHYVTSQSARAEDNATFLELVGRSLINADQFLYLRLLSP